MPSSERERRLNTETLLLVKAMHWLRKDDFPASDQGERGEGTVGHADEIDVLEGSVVDVVQDAADPDVV